MIVDRAILSNSTFSLMNEELKQRSRTLAKKVTVPKEFKFATDKRFGQSKRYQDRKKTVSSSNDDSFDKTLSKRTRPPFRSMKSTLQNAKKDIQDSDIVTRLSTMKIQSSHGARNMEKNSFGTKSMRTKNQEESLNSKSGHSLEFRTDRAALRSIIGGQGIMNEDLHVEPGRRSGFHQSMMVAGRRSLGMPKRFVRKQTSTEFTQENNEQNSKRFIKKIVTGMEKKDGSLSKSHDVPEGESTHLHKPMSKLERRISMHYSKYKQNLKKQEEFLNSTRKSTPERIDQEVAVSKRAGLAVLELQKTPSYALKNKKKWASLLPEKLGVPEDDSAHHESYNEYDVVESYNYSDEETDSEDEASQSDDLFKQLAQNLMKRGVLSHSSKKTNHDLQENLLISSDNGKASEQNSASQPADNNHSQAHVVSSDVITPPFPDISNRSILSSQGYESKSTDHEIVSASETEADKFNFDSVPTPPAPILNNADNNLDEKNFRHNLSAKKQKELIIKDTDDVTLDMRELNLAVGHIKPRALRDLKKSGEDLFGYRQSTLK